MSWKLAELRWRHEVGLYESRWEKESGALPVERKQAIETFERRGRRSRSVPSRGRIAESNLVGETEAGLGALLPPASPAARSSIDSTARQITPSRYPARGCDISNSSIVTSHKRSTSSPSREVLADQSPALKEASVSSRSKFRRGSFFSPQRESYQLHSSTLDRRQSPEIESDKYFVFGDSSGRVTTQNSEELEHLLGDHGTEVSPFGTTERLLWPTPSSFSPIPIATFPDSGDPSQHRRETLEPSVVGLFDNFLDINGALFELLNVSDTEILRDVRSPQDSSETRWASTVSKHRSTSLLITHNKMSETARPKDEMVPTEVPDGAIDTDEAITVKPQTPMRRMTPIYDDYQTAVAMIRSGTPGLPSPNTPPAIDKTSPIETADLVEVSRAPDRQFSYSMTDVHHKLQDSIDDVYSAPQVGGHIVNQSATMGFLSTNDSGRQVSSPVFPLQGRDSDDENERPIACGQYPSQEFGDNPAGLDLDDGDIPLHEMELAQVRSRSRGDPVCSQEIHASSADFDRADDLIVNNPVPPVPAATRGSDAPTDTSTIGQIVDRYGSVSDEAVAKASRHNLSASFRASFSGDLDLLDDDTPGDTVHQGKARSVTADDAGPPPSWPLPAPPALSLRSSKRRNSSSMLSSPPTYGSTSRLLDMKMFETSPRNLDSLKNDRRVSRSTVPTQLKQSLSDNDLISGVDVANSASGADDSKGAAFAHLSHVSEEPSGLAPSGFGLEPAFGFAGKHAPAAILSSLKPKPHVLAGKSAKGRQAGHVAYPTSGFEGGVQRWGRKDFGARTRFGSLDKMLVGQVDTDSDTFDVDDTDWETIHESGSNVELRMPHIYKDSMPKVGLAHSADSDDLSLKNAPVSTWDPLSSKTPKLDRSEEKVQEFMESHKKTTNTKQVGVVAKVGANDTKVPGKPAKGNLPISLPGAIPRTAQIAKPKPGAHVYQHPTPLQAAHKHPFAATRPVLHPLVKKTSTSSTNATPEQVYNLQNRNIESTSSMAGGSSSGDVASVQDENNLRVEQEIARYDPDIPRVCQVYPEARLTLDRRHRVPNRAVIESQHETAKELRRLAVFLYIFGGFALINSMTEHGEYAASWMQGWSQWRGRVVVGGMHNDDVQIARRLQNWMLVVSGAVLVLVVAVSAVAFLKST